MIILGRILVFFGLVAILHAGYSAVQCKYFVFGERVSCTSLFKSYFVQTIKYHQHFLIVYVKGRTYYKLLEEEFTGLPIDVSTGLL